MLNILIGLLAFNAYAADVATKINLKYVQQNGNSAVYEDQQTINYGKYPVDFSMRYATAFDVNDRRRDGRPLMMTVTNVWAFMDNRNVPHISLYFSFPTKKLTSGKVYTCTQGFNDTSECRVQLISARVDLNVPTENAVCKVLLNTDASLDFTNSTTAYPSYYNEGHKPFAVAYQCEKGGVKVLEGYFLHNTETVPKI